MQLIFGGKYTFHSERWNRGYDPDLYIVSIDDNNGETLQAHRSVLNNFPKVNTHSHRYL